MAASWRDLIDETAQAEVEGLWNAGLDLFGRMRMKHDDVIPSALALTAEGEIALLTVDPGSTSTDPTQDAIAELLAQLRARREQYVAVALLLDARTPQHEVLLLQLEHRDELALVGQHAYSVSRFRRRLTFGDAFVVTAERRIWVD